MTDTSSKRSTRLDDLARRAGVSISTVSRALNDNPAVSRVTKQRIWKLARELDYPFRGSMPAGPSGATATLAIVVPRPDSRVSKLSDPFLELLFANIGQAARERDCDVLLSHVTPTSLDELLYAMDTSRTEGVIFIGQGAVHGELNQLCDHDPRFVVWGAQLPDQTYCSVGSDNRLGGNRAAAHLLRLGRKALLFVGDNTAPETHQRFHGFLEAHTDAGLPPADDRHVQCHFDAESAATAIQGAIERAVPFDAVVAASDLIALGVIRGLRQAGLSVPDDVGVVGYDNIPASSLTDPALTTVTQNVPLASRLLVGKLLDTQGRPGRSVRTPTELIVRGTCGG